MNKHVEHDPDCASEEELAQWLDQMGIKTAPDPPEVELLNLVLGDEARKGTFTYFLRSELEMLQWMQQRKILVSPTVKQSDMIRECVVYYIKYFLANYVRRLNPSDPEPADVDLTADLFCAHEYTRNIAHLALCKPMPKNKKF